MDKIRRILLTHRIRLLKPFILDKSHESIVLEE